MRIEVYESPTNVNIYENKTILEVHDFTQASGAVKLNLIEAAGDILYGTAANTIDNLPISTDGKVLTIVDGLPAWVTPSGGTNQDLTNQSGSTVNNGDVIILDSDNDESFETTTTEHDLRTVGVAVETIANAAEGSVATVPGTVVTVNCTSDAVSRGDYLISSTTARKAKSYGAFKAPGVFAVALTTKASGSAGTVKAMLVHEFTRAIGGGTTWAMGGMDGSQTDNTQKYTYTTDTWSTVAGAALSHALRYPFGLGNGSTSAYSINGYDGTARSYRDELTYATETIAALANSGTNEYAGGSLTEGATKGYYFGGTDGSVRTTVTKMTYATESESTLGTSLTVARSYIAGISDGTYGYCLGGYSSGANRAYCEKITFSTDTVADHNDGDLTTAGRFGSAGMSLINAGYVPYMNSNHEKIVFSTGTSSHVSDDYAHADNYGNMGSNGNGTGIQGSSSGAEAFDESTETFSTAGAMSVNKDEAGCASVGAY